MTALGQRFRSGTIVYCLPPWTHGNVVDLIFRALRRHHQTTRASSSSTTSRSSRTSAAARRPTFSIRASTPGPHASWGSLILKPYQAAVALRTSPSLVQPGTAACSSSRTGMRSRHRAVRDLGARSREQRRTRDRPFVFWSNVPAFNDEANPERARPRCRQPAPIYRLAEAGYETESLPASRVVGTLVSASV